VGAGSNAGPHFYWAQPLRAPLRMGEIALAGPPLIAAFESCGHESRIARWAIQVAAIGSSGAAGTKE